jgi:hypothetical protein
MAWISLFLALVGYSASISPFAFHLQSYLSKKEISINASSYPAFTMEIPLDRYSSANNRTYKNRYWINDE